MNDTDTSLGSDDVLTDTTNAALPEHRHDAPPVAIESLAESAVRPLSVAEILEHGRRAEKVARICMRADLQAEYDELLAKLATMVTATGQLVDESMADDGGVSEALETNDRLVAVREEMKGWMRSIRFRAMPSDEWPAWDKKHRPTGDDPDMTDYNHELIAACAVAPRLTLDEVKQLAGALGHPQIVVMSNAAWEANTSGGIDLPKSLGSSRNRGQQSRGA